MSIAVILLNRIQFLCKIKGVSINAFLKDCGFNKSLISDLKSKGSIPAADKLAKIADYFGVTTDYLLGRDPAPDKFKVVLEREPTPEELEQINDFARFILAQEKKKGE